MNTVGQIERRFAYSSPTREDPTCTSGALRQSYWKEKGSNETQFKIDACSTKRKPHKLKPDEPDTPVNHAAICLKLSDDGQPPGGSDANQRRKTGIHNRSRRRNARDVKSQKPTSSSQVGVADYEPPTVKLNLPSVL